MSSPIPFPAHPATEVECVVYSTPANRREKLRELRIPEKVLISALQSGLIEKQTSQIFDPVTAGGYDMFRYTTRGVRAGLFQEGFVLADGNNIAAVRDPISGVTLIVCAGDSQTGMTFGEQPKTKRSKGDVFLDVNQLIGVDLFGDDVVETRRVAPKDSKTWLLLHFHQSVGEQQFFRAELSRPLEACGGVINKWSERIVLHVPLPGSVFDDETADDTGPVIVPSVKVRL